MNFIEVQEVKLNHFITGNRTIKRSEFKKIFQEAYNIQFGKKTFPKFLKSVKLEREENSSLRVIEVITEDDVIKGIEDSTLPQLKFEPADMERYYDKVIPRKKLIPGYNSYEYMVKENAGNFGIKIPKKLDIPIRIYTMYTVAGKVFRVYRMSAIFYAAYYMKWTKKEIDTIMEEESKYLITEDEKRIFQDLIFMNKNLDDSIKLLSIL